MNSTSLVHPFPLGGRFALNLLFWGIIQVSFFGITNLLSPKIDPLKAASVIGILYGLLAYLFVIGFTSIWPGLLVFIHFLPWIAPLVGMSAVTFYDKFAFTGVEYIDCLLPALGGIPLSAGMGAGITKADIGTLVEDLWLIGFLIFLSTLSVRIYFSHYR